MIFELLRPFVFIQNSGRCVSILQGVSYFFLILTIYLIFMVPTDYQQGEHYRIIFIHVPAAWMSLLLYIFITITSVLYLVSKHPIFHLFSQIGALSGCVFTLLTLLTGSLWGKPMWGTFWVWDARLTSVLILFFIYLGIHRFSLISAEMSSILVCVGLVNIPIIKFSVNWWNTLHQPSSINQFGSSVHISMLAPILLMFTCFILITIQLVLLETRLYILDSYKGSLKKYIEHN